MIENDPLWRLRHALAGVALALVLAVLVAAIVGALLGDWVSGSGGAPAATSTSGAQGNDGYTARVIFYSVLLLYVVVGAGVLFAKVAQHETRPLSVGRVGLWFISLWLWPALFWLGRNSASELNDKNRAG